MKQYDYRRESGIAHLVTLVTVVIVVVAVGGWYAWHKNHTSLDETGNNSPAEAKQTQVDTDADNQAAAQPVSQDDRYPGWKTYTSKVGSFSFKYPSDWTVTDMTTGSNDYLRISLESPTAAYGRVLLMFYVIKESFSSRYEVNDSTQTFENGLRLWTKKMQWSSRNYNQQKEFDCVRIRILEPAKDQDINLPGGVYLSSDGGFCMGQHDYTTKSYTEQLESTEMKDAIKIYESISIAN